MANKKILSKEITSYDLLKAIAVILMIVDHVGFYFFPEDNTFRAIGRLCVPIWFFLIGYARSRDLPFFLWFGMFFLVFGNFVSGLYVFPLNILGTIIIVRLIMDAFVTRMLDGSKYNFFMANFTMIILFWPSMQFFEYGTLGLLLAFLGYIIRNKNNIKLNDIQIGLYFSFVYVVFVVNSFFRFSFTGDVDINILMAGVAGVFIWLYHFRSVVYSAITVKIPFFIVYLIQLLGRQSLMVYVVHLFMFKLVAVYLGEPRFEWFYFSWLPEEKHVLGGGVDVSE